MPDSDVKKHDKFYFPDGNLVLKVENTLFRVYKYVLVRHSSVFADILTPVIKDEPEPAGNVSKYGVEGVTDDNPIVLEGIVCVDFEALLYFIFPMELGSNVRLTYFTKDQCAGALGLAKRWEIHDIRPSITEHLCKPNLGVSDKELLILATVHGLKHQKILETIERICKLSGFLDQETAEKLGIETTVNIGRLQVMYYVPETRRRSFNLTLCKQLFGYEDDDSSDDDTMTPFG